MGRRRPGEKKDGGMTVQRDGTGSAFHRRLVQEMARWQAEGLITPEQKGRILECYRRVEEIEQKAGPGKLITTISVLGSILVGVGVLLFIASNWSEIPRWGKLGIIFSSMLTSHCLGYYLRYEKENYPKVGASLILLGSIIFGAGIFLIAQIYNVTVHYPNGPLMWGLAVLPLAYLLRFKSLMTLALFDLFLWLGMELSFRTSGDYWLSHLQMVVVYFTAGIMVWRVGLAHRGKSFLRDISGAYIVVGVVVAFASAFILTFDIHRGKLGSPDLLSFYLVIGILFAAAAAFHVVFGEKEAGWKVELATLSALIGGFLVLAVFFPEIETGRGEITSRLMFNLVFAAGIIGIICLGYVRRYPPYINVGLLFFVLDVIARYFDFFWKLLPRSLFFIGGGLILLAGSVALERKRRSVLESFQVEEEAT
jgi:uncharacterized membrane protein